MMKAKPRKKEEPLQPVEEEQETISVRNVSSKKWAALRKKAKTEGRFIWSVVNEMIDDYLKK